MYNLIVDANGDEIYEFVNNEIIELTEEQKLEQYHELVKSLIREKYTIDDEFKLINVGINDNTNLDYIAYREYIENCKQQAKSTLNMN